MLYLVGVLCFGTGVVHGHTFVAVRVGPASGVHCADWVPVLLVVIVDQVTPTAGAQYVSERNTIVPIGT